MAAGESSEAGVDRRGMTITIVAAMATAGCWWIGAQLPFLIAAVVLISIIIWQACDPFADAEIFQQVLELQ